MDKRLTFTFALTGRREWGHGTQGVALGYGLAGLSARAGPQTRLFSHNLHLLNFYGILNTLPKALAIFATCSWPSLCEQSELQCWRLNRRLCGSVQISATRVLPLTFDISILNALPFRGAVASLPILIILDFEHPTCPPENTSRKSCIPTCRRTPSQIHPFHIPDADAPPPRRGRLSSQTRTRLGPHSPRGIGIRL